MSKQNRENRNISSEIGVKSAVTWPAVLLLVLAGACGSTSNSNEQSGAGATSGQTATGQGGGAAGKSAPGGGGTVSTGAGGQVAVGSGGSGAAGNSVKAGAGGSTAGKAGAKAGSGGKAGGAAGAAGGKAGAGGDADARPFGTVKVEDLGDDGPYKSVTVQNSGPGGTYTIYQPQDLAPNGSKNPVVGWVSGGGTTPIATAYPILPHLATHGFIIVATNTAPQIGTQEQLGKEILAGIDWILKENDTSGSPYYGKIDSHNIASMGYSMGGLATTTIVGDPRLTTTVHISGGTGETGADLIAKIHAPAAFFCGRATATADGIADIAGANCATDFQEVTTQTVFYGMFNGEHMCTLTPPCRDWLNVAVTGWLRWQMMNDQPLKSMFVGDQCTLCKDPNWTVQQKNMK